MRLGTVALDDIDWELVRLLQEDGRSSMKSLAAQVGLSSVATAERVQRLQDEQVITGYTCVLDKQRMNLTLHVFVVVDHLPVARRSEFYRLVEEDRHITACYRVLAGGCEAILNVYCETVEQLSELEARLKALATTSIYLVTADSDKKIISAVAAGAAAAGEAGEE